MKILGIVCSPRKGGNTEIMVEVARAVAKDVVDMVTLLSKATG
jgi:multimeric flavodoxin WrbA